MPNIIKVFHEEPFLIEPLVEDDNPDARRAHTRTEALIAYRLYVAGSTPSGIGLTALRPPTCYTRPLAALLEAFPHLYGLSNGTLLALTSKDLDPWLEGKAAVELLAALSPEADARLLPALAHPDRRHRLEPLRRLLAGDALVAFPEPAHAGIDWSIFASRPLRHRLKEAFRKYHHPDTRYFFLPYQKARSEEKFYFEQWMLDRLPSYIEELSAERD